MKNYFDVLVPANRTGKENDLEYSKSFANPANASKAFELATQRVMNINEWHDLSGIASAGFILKDEKGENCNRTIQKGDYVRIDIPGPGPKSGDGYDWVRVEKVVRHHDKEAGKGIVGILLQSCPNPMNSDSESAHFFKNGATSSFIVERKGNTLTASYHGRNEVLNVDAKKTKDKVRNAVVGAAALAGGSEAQWNALIKSFLN